MTWQAIIDQMKEWVIAQGYATVAWVQAQGYATEAWVAEWFTPYSVTGALKPNATCLYFKAGTYQDKPYYKRSDGAWFIWWDGFHYWYISSAKGDFTPPSWRMASISPAGDYDPIDPAIGMATVAAGHKSLCTSFVNRGDPPVYDFSRTSFIKDNAWHELDLSSIVPAGAKVVLFAVVISNFSVARKFKFRQHGNANDINCSAEETSISLFLLRSDWTCPVDSDRKIDYWAQTPSENWDQMNVTIKGWWF